MCGIVGAIGQFDAVPFLLDGLAKLEYRGYDSAGIAVLQPEGLAIRRSVGKLRNLVQTLSLDPLHGLAGIGHTRWATHGAPSERNAHPHQSARCVVVHNGIVENYLSLKQGLQDQGYLFRSDTDTEVIAHLIDAQFTADAGCSVPAAVRAAMQHLKGNYAIGVLSPLAPGELIVARSGCPLVLGQTADGTLAASDVIPLLTHTRTVCYLEDGDLAILRADGMQILDAEDRPVHRATSDITWDTAATEKNGFAHHMLKEIHEQPQTILDTLHGHYDYEQGTLQLPDLHLPTQACQDAQSIWIVACGTSWHAGLVGKYVLESLLRLPVHHEIASEFRYRNPMIRKEDLVITISQSGETADTLAAAREARAQGARVISIVNVVGSTLARESDGVVYTACGPEIGVASTKAFTAQLTALYLVALYLGRARKTLTAPDVRVWIDRLVTIPSLVRELVQRDEEIQAIAARFAQASNMLFLGRGINFPIALEGALKLKELSYIHAEGYAAGEMKHGPIALLDEGMPVVVLAPHDHLYDKTLNNLMEVKARQAPVIAFVTEGKSEVADCADVTFPMPHVHPLLSPILYSIPLQLLAYHIACLRGTDVDQPRNLAKSVTVE